MKKLFFGCSVMFFALMLMAAPGAVPSMIEKTFTGKIQFLEEVVKGQKTSGYYIVSGETQIKLPTKAKANIDLKQYVNKDVTVVVKGSSRKVKVKKSTEDRFTGVEIISIKINAAAAAEEKEAEEE